MLRHFSRGSTEMITLFSQMLKQVCVIFKLTKYLVIYNLKQTERRNVCVLRMLELFVEIVEVKWQIDKRWTLKMLIKYAILLCLCVWLCVYGLKSLCRSDYDNSGTFFISVRLRLAEKTNKKNYFVNSHTGQTPRQPLHFMPGFVCSNMNFLQCSQANTDRNNSNSGNNRQLSEQKQNDEEEEVREVKQKKLNEEKKSTKNSDKKISNEMR